MRKPLTLSLFALLTTLAPLFAGEVYIPFASNQSVGGVLYKTSVWVSNPGPTERRFTTMFVTAETDGSKAVPAPGSISVSAGGTVLLGAAPNGTSGILEISGAPQLVVNARLDAIGANGVVLSSTDMPPVTQTNVLAANSVAQLQGLKRTADGTVTDFALLNLSRAAAQCTVKSFRADGTAITAPVVLSLKPLSQRQFNEALAVLGAPNISDARFEATCNQQFFTFAKVYQVSGPQSAFISPSPALVGDLVPGGPGGPVDTPGVVTLDAPGTFLRAVNGNSYISYNFPAKAGVPYKLATIEFDMGIGQMSTELLFTGVTSFRRPSSERSQRVMYYGIQIVNRNSKTTLDLGVQDVLVKTVGPWKNNHNYHVKISYDMVARQVTLQTYEGGVLTYTIAGNIQHFDLSANSNPLQVDFGQTGIADG
ncbi:MAG TPA: hypothetical protein VGE98_03745, partial [Thermoanaerobaculia bacterium]